MFEEIYGVEKETIYAIGEFTLNWMLFENYYLNKRASMKKIMNLDASQFDLSDSINKFQTEVQQFIRKNTITLISSSAITCNMIQQCLYTDEAKPNKEFEAIVKFIEGTQIEAKGCFLCIYRIRNNLLHGEKGIWNINGQKGILKASSDVLSILNDPDNHNAYLRRSSIP